MRLKAAAREFIHGALIPPSAPPNWYIVLTAPFVLLMVVAGFQTHILHAYNGVILNLQYIQRLAQSYLPDIFLLSLGVQVPDTVLRILSKDNQSDYNLLWGAFSVMLLLITLVLLLIAKSNAVSGLTQQAASIFIFWFTGLGILYVSYTIYSNNPDHNGSTLMSTKAIIKRDEKNRRLGRTDTTTMNVKIGGERSNEE